MLAENDIGGMIIFFSIWGGLTLIGSFALLFYFALSK
jgi:hypothetical protein